MFLRVTCTIILYARIDTSLNRFIRRMKRFGLVFLILSIHLLFLHQRTRKCTRESSLSVNRKMNIFRYHRKRKCDWIFIVNSHASIFWSNSTEKQEKKPTIVVVEWQWLLFLHGFIQACKKQTFFYRHPSTYSQDFSKL